MRAAMVLWGVLACGLLWAQPSEPTELRVRVVNREQQPLTNARVGALAVDFRRLQVMPATEPLMQPVDAQARRACSGILRIRRPSKRFWRASAAVRWCCW